MYVDRRKNAEVIRRLDDRRRAVAEGFVRYKDFLALSDRLRTERVIKMISAPNSKELIEVDPIF